VYEAFGMDLQRVNGGNAHTLPLPATYVIDYTTRAEPTDIIAALDPLAATAAKHNHRPHQPLHRTLRDLGPWETPRWTGKQVQTPGCG